MTSYRAMDGVAGRPGVGSTGTQPPATAIAYTGDFIAGIEFTVTDTVWFEGFWYWVASGAPTIPQRFALWTTGSMFDGEKQLIADATVTSGTLSPGWNFVACTNPVSLAAGTSYIAAAGVNGGFNDTPSQFGTGDPYSDGITNGPLRIYSGLNGTYPNHGAAGAGMNNGVFSTTGTDPSVTMPNTGDTGGDGTTNFWVDVQVSDTPPAGYTGSFRLQPNTVFSDAQGSIDDAQPYNLATEFRLSEGCDLNAIWFLSPKGATGGLPTQCAIWRISDQAKVAEDTSPTWSGAEASGWVSCSFTGVTLPAGDYKVAAYNESGASGPWGYKRLGFWQGFTDSGGSTFRVAAPTGIHNGPLYAPTVADASNAKTYQNETLIQPGQGTFSVGAVGTPAPYPDLYVNDANATAQYYGVDVEVTVATAPPPPASITTASPLPQAQTGTTYTAPLQGDGTPPFTWTATGLPPGLAVVDQSIAGTPTTAGSFTAHVTLTDANNQTASADLAIVVTSPPPPQTGAETVPVVVMPDAELVALTALRGLLGARSESYAQGVTVGRTIPAGQKPAKFVQVRRIGGRDETVVTDRARLDVLIWQDTPDARMALGQMVRGFLVALVGTFNGVTCYGGTTFMTPVQVPDPADDTREIVMLTVDVDMRGAQLS